MKEIIRSLYLLMQRTTSHYEIGMPERTEIVYRDGATSIIISGGGV
ncbi:MAG: hypothetical protein HGB04_06720 [Chlorobiaceae bacterium]|nr:hypothetical protein [Chlorobiaceae bacterium]